MVSIAWQISLWIIMLAPIIIIAILVFILSSFSVIEWSKVWVSVIACDKVIWALMLDNVGYLSVLKHPQKLYGSIPNPTIPYPTKHFHTRTYYRQALVLDNVGYLSVFKHPQKLYCNITNPTPPNFSVPDPSTQQFFVLDNIGYRSVCRNYTLV